MQKFLFSDTDYSWEKVDEDFNTCNENYIILNESNGNNNYYKMYCLLDFYTAYDAIVCVAYNRLSMHFYSFLDMVNENDHLVGEINIIECTSDRINKMHKLLMNYIES